MLWGNDGRCLVEIPWSAYDCSVEEVVLAGREIGVELCIRHRFELDSPVRLPASE